MVNGAGADGFPPFVWTKGGQGVCGRRGAGARWRVRASHPCRFPAHHGRGRFQTCPYNIIRHTRAGGYPEGRGAKGDAEPKEN